jgi:hypothetical protein
VQLRYLHLEVIQIALDRIRADAAIRRRESPDTMPLVPRRQQ